MLSGSAGIFGIKQSSCYVGFELSVSESENKESCDKLGYLAMWACFYQALTINTREEFPGRRKGPISLPSVSPSSGKVGDQGYFDFVGCEGLVAIEVEADRDRYRFEGVT